MARMWVGIDTGGTFTDLVLIDIDQESYVLHKVPTTPEDASEGILQGLREIIALAGGDPSQVGLVSHGTTLGTNAVLEGKWARTGMITTAGFRDILELARQRRPSFFNLDIEKPRPPASRDLRVEVGERVAPDGSVVAPLDEAALRAAVWELKDSGCEAVAVCFLHSYANPAHERRSAEILGELWPEAYVCTSSDILPEFREFERFATATVNASLMPIMDRYLARFEAGVRALGVPVAPDVMQSNGGAASPSAVRRAPVNTFFSGPAGGVIGAAGLGVAAAVPDLITFDMGGTSTDVCLVRAGVPSRKNVREMGGFPVRTRTLDIHTIGAGGGSIAWIDPGGLLKVGPKSAGARPGPACYGRGGELPTVTDANMLLGRLSQAALLDGRMPVFPDRARRAVAQGIAQPLGIDAVRAAAGILDIVNANMMGAVRVISVEQGEDPRRFALMPFGGAGPLHATDIANSMGIPNVWVPQHPGLLSALGLLHADVRGDFSLTRLVPAEAGSIGSLNEGLADLSARAGRWLAAEGHRESHALHERQADMRYFGQNFELAVPLDAGLVDEATLARTVAGFNARHKAAYGYEIPGHPVEIVNLRLSVTVRRPQPPLWSAAGAGASLSGAVKEERPVWFAETGFVATPVYSRTQLPPEARFSGPAIVEQMDATTVVPPGSRVEVDRFGNMMIRLNAASQDRVAA